MGIAKDEPHIFVVTSDGEFLNYKIDFYHGGEGKLEKQFSYSPLLLSLNLDYWILLMNGQGRLQHNPRPIFGIDTCSNVASWEFIAMDLILSFQSVHNK